MNALIGDKALEELVSPKDLPTLSEKDKIRCHLSFALQELKRDKPYDVSALSSHGQSRQKALDSLEEYIDAGDFPRNENEAAELNGRLPCFVDRFGTHCAVAHMMKASGVPASLVQSIATTHQYETIEKMSQDPDLSPVLASWAKSNGLKVADLALIQPTYEFEAEEAERMFNNIFSTLGAAIRSRDKPMTEIETQQLCHKMVVFGDQMITGFGWPQHRCPKLLKTLKILDDNTPKDNTKLDRLVQLFRREVQRATMSVAETQPDDYEGLLSESDLGLWKDPNGFKCENRRLGNVTVGFGSDSESE